MRRVIFFLSIVALGAVASLRAQTLTEVFLPQYIQGLNGTNTNRIPCAYRVTLGGLTENATYRYFNQVVIDTDPATTNGAGNVIFVKTDGSDFVRSTGPSIATVGNHGEFTTDGSGSYTGWFVTEPTGNARFVPGASILFRIMLNDGAGGTTVVTRLTTTNGVTVLNLGTTSSDATGIRGSSYATPKNFVLLYDNVSGTGRPVAATFLESDGTANTTGNSYAAFYANNVNGVTGAWGTLLPNTLPNGIRRVEERSLVDGSLVHVATDPDGIWPSGANTINPNGGTTDIVLTTEDAPLPVQLASFTAHVIPGEGIRLSWRTISELNNYGFFVQRRLQGESAWVEVAGSFIPGSGTTNEPREYSFTDVAVAAGAWQYRLRQVDLDGSSHFSEPVSVSLLTSVGENVAVEFALTQNYPNPFNPATTITFSVPRETFVTLEVFNMIGERVATLVNGRKPAGVHSAVFDASELSSGVYLYRMSAADFVSARTLVVLK